MYDLFVIQFIILGLLHTILFNRALGTIRPIDCECEIFDVPYIKAELPLSYDKLIEENIEKLFNTLKIQGKGKLCLSFYSSITTPSYFGLMSSEEKRHFERWFIPISFIPDSQKGKYPPFTSQNLRDRIISIVTMVGEKKDHLPPIGDSLCYLFEITIPSSANDRWGFSIFLVVSPSGVEHHYSSIIPITISL